MCVWSLALAALFVHKVFVEGAVIEVTAGGKVVEPTYQFSDISGAHLVNLTGSADKVKASGDMETGSGNSVNTMAAELSAMAAELSFMRMVTMYTTPWAQAWNGNTFYFLVRQRGIQCPGGTSPVTEAECRSIEAAANHPETIPFGDWWKLAPRSNSYGFPGSTSAAGDSSYPLSEPNKLPGCTMYANSIVWNIGGTTNGWSETHWKPVCKLSAPSTMHV